MEFLGKGRVLCLHAAAKRLQIPERTLRYRASRGRVQGAFKQGKLWKFWLPALEAWRPPSPNGRPELTV
jgi:hypothetical protein